LLAGAIWSLVFGDDYMVWSLILRFSMGCRMRDAQKPPVAPENESMNTSKTFSKFLSVTVSAR